VVINADHILHLLEDVCDPEVPVLSIVDLGVVRGVEVRENSVEVRLTPTYSGCPAMDVISSGVRERLEAEGFSVQITMVLSPAWTTDWLSEAGKEKLLAYGIAPPVDTPTPRALFGAEPIVHCPQCGSAQTELLSLFGSTACKALYRCKDCLEPFDYFKCLK
jgi:ring-1,2-phenylacetyl-CoA epoxidase subunit PaaD